MDSLSHAAIGMAVAGLSGHHPSLGDPIFIATMLGAQAPDFDLVAQIKGNMAYLKQHRAFSHSVPGVFFFASLIALSLSLLLPNAHFGQAFVWAFAGALSHTLIDYFNTHGVALLWPLARQRKSFPLLKVFDPLVLIICLLPYWGNLLPVARSLLMLSGLAGYILLRIYLRKLASGRIIAAFPRQNIRRLWIMPSLRKPLFWDFVVETDRRSINGRLGIFSPAMEIKADMPRQLLSTLTAKAKKTALGQFFLLFTPFSYFEVLPDEKQSKVNIYDLRYFSGQQFIHRATIVFNKDNDPCETYIHSMGRTIKVEPAL